MPENVEEKRRHKPKERAVDLGALDWALTLAQATWITSGLVVKAVKGLSHGRKDGTSFHEYISYEGMRDYQCGLTPIGIQNLVTSTSKTCRSFAKSHGISHSTVEIHDGTAAHWLGPPKASNHVVLFHGGGYMAPALSKHIDFAFGFTDPPLKDLAVIVLQYDLASEAANHYPRQLQQAVSLLDHLIHAKEISPSSIILLGDSAGAHLLFSLMLHLAHPNPLVTPLIIQDHFPGAALISPWLNLYTPAESMRSCDKPDILDPVALESWAKNFLAGTPRDYWNDPLSAPKEWWGDVPIDDILITYGDDEVLRDEIEQLSEVIKQVHPSTTAMSFPGELHVHMIMNRFLRINKSCESEKVYRNWLETHLK